MALVLVAVALLTRVEGQQRDRDQPRGRSKDEFVEGELLVKFSSALSSSQRESILSTRRFARLRRFDALGVELVRVPPGLAVAVAAGGLGSLSGVVTVQPNYLRYPIQSAPPNDQYWLEGRLWGLQQIQAPHAWSAFSRGDDRVVVASIDTGINYRHPDLAANMWRNPFEIPGNGIDDDGNGYVDDVFGIDARKHSGDPVDEHGHGTLTAGTIAAVGNNSEGLVGVTWNTKLLACKFMGADGVGTDAGAIECFNYIVALRNRGVNIRVSSNGWGAARGDGPRAGALAAAIDAAGAAGILNVFGAGNDGKDTDREPFDPAGLGLPTIVSVASSDRNDARSPFSNYGAASVDLAAPGEDILTTHAAAYASASGTSMAAAHVAGTAALLAGLDPTLSADGMKVLLLRTVDPLPQWTGQVASGGRLNAFRAAGAVATGPNAPPTVSIQHPADGDVLTSPVNVTIDAIASDQANGTIKQVAFFANGALVGTATTAPFSVAWSPANLGTYALTAVATDNLDATATSAAVSVTVVAPNAAPSVSLTSPGPGGSFQIPAAIAIAATAADTDGSVSSVTFYANGVPIGEDQHGPFAMSWSPTAPGDYILTAAATDNEGATTTSGGVPVTILAANVPPGVSVTSPEAGGSFQRPVTILVSASANDADGTVASVAFYANGALIGTDSAGPFAVQWSPATAGDYILTAVATDNQGATTTSGGVAVTIRPPNVAPTIALTAPAAGEPFVAPVSIAVAASAGDPDGTIMSVSFFADGVPIGSDSTSPYSVLWSNVAPGTYTVTASATDNSGATSFSGALQVTVAVPPRINVALAANGSVATASSVLGANYGPSGAINGDRRGLGWGNGGGWNDGTANAYPDWLTIQFNALRTIDEVDVFSMQDAFSNPIDPTPDLVFTTWGLRAFDIQYWDGTGWANVPGASIANNNLVWRRFTLVTPVTTSAIRLVVNAALNGSSRVIEVEAWGTAAYGPEAEPLSPKDSVSRNDSGNGLRESRSGMVWTPITETAASMAQRRWHRPTTRTTPGR
ncbi:MAG TPA: Ig-like domain-containing protein [Vicinamibacterales bacterium]|nr:Ig-like domain-containing protein [Vicinamibacterales bacterium]